MYPKPSSEAEVEEESCWNNRACRHHQEQNLTLQLPVQYFDLSCAYQAASLSRSSLELNWYCLWECVAALAWSCRRYTMDWWDEFIMSAPDISHIFLNLCKGCLRWLTMSAPRSCLSVGFLINMTSCDWLCNFDSANSPPPLRLFNLRKKVKMFRSCL